MNQLCIVGRLTKNPEGEIITIAVNRSYKNAEGIYETDFIDILLGNDMARNVTEYCRKGDLIGIRGRLENREIDDGDGHILRKGMIVVADKVTFLSSRNGGE